MAWTLYTDDGVAVVEDVSATAEEILVVVKAANTKRPEHAPHYASSGSFAGIIETDEEIDVELVDRSLAEYDAAEDE